MTNSFVQQMLTLSPLNAGIYPRPGSENVAPLAQTTHHSGEDQRVPGAITELFPSCHPRESGHLNSLLSSSRIVGSSEVCCGSNTFLSSTESLSPFPKLAHHPVFYLTQWYHHPLQHILQRFCLLSSGSPFPVMKSVVENMFLALFSVDGFIFTVVNLNIRKIYIYLSIFQEKKCIYE